ncbi:MAG TPA: response regulator [Candidatus Binataceae bacterium]
MLTFRVGTLTIAFFQSAYITQAIYFAHPSVFADKRAALGADLLIVILPLLAFGLSFWRWFASYWRALTLTLCIALVGLSAAANVIRHESVPMFVETMLLLVGAGALVPWDERRQAALGAFSLAAFAADQALGPAPDAYVYIRWLGMIGAAFVAQIAVHLTGLYRRNLAAHCDALAATREQALLASRAKSEFLSTMSHEIRTPMNSVLGMAEVLAETNLDGDQSRYLETLRFNGGALMRLLDDILDLAKVESGCLHLRNKEFDLAELVEKTVESLALRAHGKGLELVARIVPGTPSRLRGDPLRLRQVLMNLLGNAIKFTESGSVELTVADDDDDTAAGNDTADTRIRAVRFSVADTGIGIESAKLAEIFASFTQADSSDTRKYGGSGLGLAIASRLAALMGGRIAVESAPGRGSTFHFTAPLEFADTAAEPAPAHDLRTMRVLVADRNAANRRIFVETLTSFGAGVEEASTVAETIAALRRALGLGRPFDLVFGDCRMSGIEQIERLAAPGCACGAAMIVPMLTTDDLTSKIARVRRLGFEHHLLKPVRRSDLLELISRAAKTHKNKPPEAKPNDDAATAPALSAAPSPPARTAPPIASPTRPLRVLFAEDSSDNRLLITAYFKHLPYQVETAENGKVAVDKFVHGRYDLVLMDMQMPVMDGYAAVRLIRAWEREHRLAATPVLALTASTLDDDITRALDAGCDRHVSKPVRKASLLAAIHETLASAAARDVETARASASAPAAPARLNARLNGLAQ